MRIGLRARVGPVVVSQSLHRPRYSNERQARWGVIVGEWCLITIVNSLLGADALTAGCLAILSMLLWRGISALWRSLRTVP